MVELVAPWQNRREYVGCEHCLGLWVSLREERGLSFMAV